MADWNPEDYMDECTDGWRNVWMDESMHGWMDRWMDGSDGWMDGCTSGWVVWMNNKARRLAGQSYGWWDGLMYAWEDGRVDRMGQEWMNESDGGCSDGCLDWWVDGWVDVWMGGRVHVWVDEGMER